MRTLGLRRCIRCKERKPLNRKHFKCGWHGYMRICLECKPEEDTPLSPDRRSLRDSWIDVCVLVQLREDREAAAC